MISGGCPKLCGDYGTLFPDGLLVTSTDEPALLKSSVRADPADRLIYGCVRSFDDLTVLGYLPLHQSVAMGLLSADQEKPPAIARYYCLDYFVITHLGMAIRSEPPSDEELKAYLDDLPHRCFMLPEEAKGDGFKKNRTVYFNKGVAIAAISGRMWACVLPQNGWSAPSSSDVVLEPPSSSIERKALKKLYRRSADLLLCPLHEQLRASLAHDDQWKRPWWVRLAEACGWKSLLAVELPSVITKVATDGVRAGAFVAQPGSPCASLHVVKLSSGNAQKIEIILEGGWKTDYPSSFATITITSRVLACATTLGSLFVFVRDEGQELYTFHGRIDLNGIIEQEEMSFLLSLAVKGLILAVSVGGALRFWDLEKGTRSGCWESTDDESFTSLIWKDDASCLIAVDRSHQLHMWRTDEDFDELIGLSHDPDRFSIEFTKIVDSPAQREDPKDWLAWRWAIDRAFKKSGAMSRSDWKTRCIQLYHWKHPKDDGFYTGEYVGRCGLDRVPPKYLS
eukprot:TRINITY_DN74847_c0_g1_i1.p1 TRINITY_DN74847_c0_g1~~TRINITY_DN74847_c0_g1_i1.p1  ORF type:complete len:563 (+),score=51.01 TRINITY_DN74847_c0_g1_i1:164-1690(+)